MLYFIHAAVEKLMFVAKVHLGILPLTILAEYTGKIFLTHLCQSLLSSLLCLCYSHRLFNRPHTGAQQ